MSRLVILGNSLSMPRPGDRIMYEDIYPYILANPDLEVINRSKRVNDIEIQSMEQNIVDDVDDLRPDYLVIHLGIVDCAPRIFSKNNRKLLSLLPGSVVNYIVRFVSKHRYAITKSRRISFVDIELFETCLRNMLIRIRKKTPHINIIILKILQTNKRNIERSYNFDSNIEKYNNVIERVSHEFNLFVKLIDINKHNDGLLEDGIHIPESVT